MTCLDFPCDFLKNIHVEAIGLHVIFCIHRDISLMRFLDTICSYRLGGQTQILGHTQRQECDLLTTCLLVLPLCI
jgi:hypothetical protein